jgi:hypothetical protein
MMMEVRMRTQILLVALAASACTVDMDDPTVSTVGQQVGTHNRLATNRLATNRLATNRLATNRLATNSLSQLIANPETSGILDTEEGREVYSYVVSCALPVDTNILAYVPGAADSAPDANYTCVRGNCTFYGALNLAPSWLDQRLNKKGKAWISACLFARVNVHETAEAISLRGSNPGLAVTVDEAELYPIEEGAFYGNVFLDDPDPNVLPEWYACRGEHEAISEDGGLALRDCAEEDPGNPGYTYCGFKYTGDCRDFTPEFPNPYACDGFVGFYKTCYERPGAGRWGGASKHRYVITSFVSP